MPSREIRCPIDLTRSSAACSCSRFWRRSCATSAAPRASAVIYDGAPHSFFDRAMSDHEEACADAWRLVLRFMAVPAD